MSAQSRRMSLAESCANIAVGFALQLTASALILPWFGFRSTPGNLLTTSLIFTVLSLTRSYTLRRLFERAR